MEKIIFINGPNLNWLGRRDNNLYGSGTLDSLEQELKETCSNNDYEFLFFQTNSEGEFINLLQDHYQQAAGFIINPGAYSHTSLAIKDALLSIEKPVIEVHLSNVARREQIRRQLLTASAVDGVIIGLGRQGYHLAVKALVDKISN